MLHVSAWCSHKALAPHRDQGNASLGHLRHGALGHSQAIRRLRPRALGLGPTGVCLCVCVCNRMLSYPVPLEHGELTTCLRRATVCVDVWKGVNTTRRFLLEWLSFLYRYVPVGLLEHVPQALNERPPPYVRRHTALILAKDVMCALLLPYPYPPHACALGSAHTTDPPAIALHLSSGAMIWRHSWPARTATTGLRSRRCC